MSPVLPLLRQVRELTEQQLDAAKRIDGAALQRLNEARSDALFDLRVALDDHDLAQADDRAQLAHEARLIALLEVRLARVAGLVLDTLSPSRGTQTYGRSGRVASVP